MKTALKFSFLVKKLNHKSYNFIIKHFENSKLPGSIQSYFKLKHLNQILHFMEKDKKNNSNNIKLVLLENLGKPIIHNENNKYKLRLFLKKELSYGNLN